MSKEVNHLSDAQRKALVALVTTNYSSDIWSRARRKYDEFRSSRKQAMIKELMPDDVRKLAADIVSLKDKLETLESQLSERRFSIDSDNEIEVLDSNKRFAGALERRLDEELGTSEEVLTRPFETAQVKLLTVATAEEAEKIVEPLLNFEVKVK